jgi:predicted GNAT family acetyltransferase
MTQSEINDNKSNNTLEIWVDDKRSFIEYEVEGEKIYLLHTEVPEEQNNQGIAADLVEKAFIYLEGINLKVVPACSYVRSFIRKHPEWERIGAVDNN